MTEHLLLTGATGLLGRYLLVDLLLADVPVAVLVRKNRRQSPEQRVEAMLQSCEKQLQRPLPRPVVLGGDICQRDLGLTQDSLRWMTDHCDSVLHNAASLSFIATNGREGEPWRSNVDGLKTLLDVCERTGVRDFHHVSTAYVCGDRTGTILETEFDEGQTPGNDYEASKIEAERLVRSATFCAPPTVFRPGIIIGDSKTGFTTTFHGFYALLRLAHTLVRSESVTDRHDVNRRRTRLTLSGAEEKNLVPVDWVSAVMTHILCNRQFHGKTYHLTPRKPVTVADIQAAIETSLDFHNTEFVGHDIQIDDPSVVEMLFYEHLHTYESYWRNDATFDFRQTTEAAPHLPCPEINRELLVRLAQVAIEMDFRYKDPAARKSSTSTGLAPSHV